jgi:hypothetical protein
MRVNLRRPLLGDREPGFTGPSSSVRGLGLVSSSVFVMISFPPGPALGTPSGSGGRLRSREAERRVLPLGMAHDAVAHELAELEDRLVAYAVDCLPALASSRHEPRLPQDVQVFRYRGLRDAELFREGRHIALAPLEPQEQPHAGRVGECPQRPDHAADHQIDQFIAHS